MGVIFRDGDYIRFVRIGGRTIKDGEAAVVWSNRGVSTQIIGPKRANLWYSTISFLSLFKAEASQYVVVKYRDGRVEHVPGPVSMYMNPTVHNSMKVKDGLKLESEDDCIVVFSSYTAQDNLESSSGEKIPSSGPRIVYGPTIHFPTPNETVNTFNWKEHSTNLNYPVCRTNRFQVLHLRKMNLWSFGFVIKTAESNGVEVNLAITYDIESIEKCLAAQNPIELMEPAILHDALNCAESEADIAKWIVKESTFPTFCETMASVGFRLLKIQVLNVEPSMETKRKAIEEKHLAQRKDTSQIEQQVKAAEKINATELNYLKGLQEMGVDVTQVLCAAGGKVEWIGESEIRHPIVYKSAPKFVDNVVDPRELRRQTIGSPGID